MSARPLIAWRWLGVPAVLCVAATVLFAVPIEVLGLRLPEPVFPLVLAFAWAVIRPSVLAPFLLLILGLFLDLFWGGPAALWALSLLAAYAMALIGRGVINGQGPAMSLFWYILTLASAFGPAYGLVVFLGLTPPNLIALFWQFLATSLLYPLAHHLIERFEDADVRFR